MDDATAIDEAASAFTSPGCRVESLFRMKDSVGDVEADVGFPVVGVVERDFPRGRTIGVQVEGQTPCIFPERQNKDEQLSWVGHHLHPRSITSSSFHLLVPLEKPGRNSSNTDSSEEEKITVLQSI